MTEICSRDTNAVPLCCTQASNVVSPRQRLFVVSSRSQVQPIDTASTHLQATVPSTRSCSIVPLRHQTSSVLASFLDGCSQIIFLFKLVPVFGLASLASLEEGIIGV